MKTKIRTYGKQSFPQRIFREVKERFKINPLTERTLKDHGIGCYIPKLNKARFIISVVLVVVCIATPIITPLSIPALLWGIK